MSRFVFLSVLLVAYSGLTLGLILWNSSSGPGASSSGGSRAAVEERQRRINPAAPPTAGREEEWPRTASGVGWARPGERPAGGVDGEPAAGRESLGKGGLDLEVVGSGQEQLGGAAAVYAGGAHALGAAGVVSDGAQRVGQEDWRGSLGMAGEVRERTTAVVTLLLFPLSRST